MLTCPGAPQASTETAALASLARRTESIAADVDAALNLARELDAPLPGAGATLRRWEMLATLGVGDLTVARVVEPHLDAVAILAEAAAAGIEVDLGAVNADGAGWGVFAAEGPGMKLTATPAAPVDSADSAPGGRWLLSGRKPWCSLADRLTHALVTAHTENGRRLFAVDLRSPSVRVDAGVWAARGLTDVTSGPVSFSETPAVPIGGTHWYLERAGFAWGGIGVAAVWLGGAIGVARRLYDQCAAKPDEPLRLMNLGAVDSALAAATAVLRESAALIDADAEDPALLAGRVRAVVADAAELVLIRVGHALGPAPLALDAEHARRVADLQLYLRQHHAERDQAALGAMLVEAGRQPW